MGTSAETPVGKPLWLQWLAALCLAPFGVISGWMGATFLAVPIGGKLPHVLGWAGPLTFLLGSWLWWRRSGPVRPRDLLRALFRPRRNEGENRVPFGAWVFLPVGGICYGCVGLLASRSAVYVPWLVPFFYPVSGVVSGAVLWQAAVQGYLFFPPRSAHVSASRPDSSLLS